jgi:hypothetical protein
MHTNHMGRKSYPSDRTFAVIDEEGRKKIVTDFISQNQGCNKQYIVNGVSQHIGRVKVYSILKDLKHYKIISEEKTKPNSRDIRVYLNITNPLVIVPKELDEFEVKFFSLLKKAIEKFHSHRSKYITTDTRSLIIPDKLPAELAHIYALLLEPLRIFNDIVNIYIMHSILSWPNEIKDKETLNTLQSTVFTKRVNMQSKISEVQNTLNASLANSHKIILQSLLLDRVSSADIKPTMTDKLLQYYETFRRFDMQKEIEPVLDFIWKITYKYREYLYLEPWMHGWDYKYEDGWKKLIELKKQHVAQTSTHSK